MKEVTISQLVDLLDQPLAQDTMKGSRILLLRESFKGFHPVRSFSKTIELNAEFFKYGFPEGELVLPVQYTNGLYPEEDGDREYTNLDQGLATIFHPEFFEGKEVMTFDGEPYRPLTDGYLDFERGVLENYVDIESPDFERALNYSKGLSISGIDNCNAEELVQEHIRKFSELYKIREFLREPERGLVEKSFKPI